VVIHQHQQDPGCQALESGVKTLNAA